MCKHLVVAMHVNGEYDVAQAMTELPTKKRAVGRPHAPRPALQRQPGATLDHAALAVVAAPAATTISAAATATLAGTGAATATLAGTGAAAVTAAAAMTAVGKGSPADAGRSPRQNAALALIALNKEGPQLGGNSQADRGGAQPKAKPAPLWNVHPAGALVAPVGMKMLTQDELNEVEAGWCRGKLREVIKVINFSRNFGPLTIMREDMARLDERNEPRWLNDEIMNFSLGILQQVELRTASAAAVTAKTGGRAAKIGAIDAAAEASAAKTAKAATATLSASVAGATASAYITAPKVLPRVHFMNSFFFSKLTPKGVYAYGSVRRWTRKLDYFIFDCDLVCVPVNFEGEHWVMVGIYFKEKRIVYCDGFWRELWHVERGVQVMRCLLQFVKDEVADKKGVELEMTEWRMDSLKNIPVQDDGHSCGVFSLMFARYLARGEAMNFSQTNMAFLRRQIAADVLRGWTE